MVGSKVRNLAARASGALLLLSLMPAKALAAAADKVEGVGTGGTGGNVVSDATPIAISNQPLGSIITTIINVTLGILGVLAVLYLVYGGVQYITAGGDAEKAAKGRTAITNAIIGVVIIAVSLALYNFVAEGLGAE